MKTWYSSKIFGNFVDFFCIIFWAQNVAVPSNCVLIDCADYTFSKPFKSSYMRILFTILLIVWLKKVGFVLMIWKKKKCFNRGIVMTKEDDEDFEFLF